MTKIKVSLSSPLISILSIGLGVVLHYVPTVTRKIISPIMAFISGVIS